MKLHIISLNVPYPPNYGGIIDIFYKIKALHELGVNIILHNFDYGRGKQEELDKYCQKVYYYKRKKSITQQFSKTPFIIKTRNSGELLKNLVKDNDPILFEGLHTTFFLTNPALANRVKIVRTHNVEHEYYQLLEEQERFLPRKMFYKAESVKLKQYESVLEQADCIAAISPNDQKYFGNQYGRTLWLPPFHSNNGYKCEFGLGSYALYHGNLSVVENIEAVQFLINAFANTDIPITISGKNPEDSLKKELLRHKNFQLIANPSFAEMIDLIKDAQILLLPTFQPTGIKLKLIESLYIGRHVVANTPMIQGTGLEKLCHLANNREEFINKASKLMTIPFENKDLIVRKEVLGKHFNNSRNAQYLKNIIIDLNT